MHPLAARRAPDGDSRCDNPCLAEPLLTSTHSDLNANSLKRSCCASCQDSDLLLSTLSEPGIGSGQGNGTVHSALPAVNSARINENGDKAKDGTNGGLTGMEGKPEVVWPSKRADRLTGEDIQNLNAVLQHAIADSTKSNYRVQWLRFAAWAEDRKMSALPSDPAHVAAYLAERSEKAGHRPGTLRAAASAIAFIHRAAGLADPCASSAVRRILSGATRKAGRMQKQAAALTAKAFARIQATAYKPRRGRGGRLESRTLAKQRGSVDVAIISLMRDAMLRVSEAAHLTWADIGAEPDDTGRLLIRRSKTDPGGEGAVVFLSTATMTMLAAIRDGAAVGASVFGLHPNQIAKRIKQAARVAGLGEGFSGHSPRVGMARDLARAGIELPRLMNAGRWRSPTMPALYTRNETAGRGAVAQFYGTWRTPA